MLTGLGLAAVSGCCEPGFTPPREIEFEPQAELRAIAAGDLPPYYLVDMAGRVTILDSVRVGREYELAVVDSVELGSAPLVDIEVSGGGGDDNRIWVVDAVGTVYSSFDSGQSWTSHSLDTELEPRGLVHLSPYVIVYGDDFVRALRNDAWFELPAPEGGWGSLRAAIELGDMLVLSDGESLLVAEGDPLESSWQRIDAPTEVLAFDGGILSDLRIGGREGRVMATKAASLGPNSIWDELQLDTQADIVAIEYPYVLTDAGELFELDTLTMLDVGDANAGMAHASVNLVMFGAMGPLVTTKYECCLGK